jgi:methylenetetrahydrofolate dehydrogenase (NADP+)/methenyltetrahydrofolate cyclohydrolase
MQILNGKVVSDLYRAKLKSDVAEFTKKYGKPPGLAVVLVGDDPASHVYVSSKEKACLEAGILSQRFDIDKEKNVEELDSLLNHLNADQDIHGVLVQIPVPQPFDYRSVLKLLDPKKDADGLTYESMGRLWAGDQLVAPCTPKGVMAILEHYKIPIKGKRAVVVGRSNIVGKPMAQLLMDQDATVTIVHSKTSDLRSHTKEADIVVVAAGKPRIFGKDDFKKGSVVVDVGIHRLEGKKLCGDVRFEELEGHCAAATPVPGGVGPMTITMLLKNTVELAKKIESQREKSFSQR